MRIVYLSASQLPSRFANSVHVMKMCQAFGMHDHDVTLLAQENDRSISDDYIFDYYGTKPVFDLVRLPRKSMGAIGAIEYTLRQNQVIHDLSGVDLLYSRYIHGALAVAREGIPIIFEAHGPPRSNFEWLQYRILFESSNFVRLVVISNALKQMFLKSFPSLNPLKVCVAHDGADLPEFATTPRPYSSISDTKQLTAGYIGSLYTGRGIDLIGQVARDCPGVDFHIVGGALREIKHWQEVVPYTNIQWHGFVPHSKLQEYFARFDVLLAPYQRTVGLANSAADTSRYMSPLKIFEYMAQGKAIIASNLPVLQEVLVHEQNCLLCDPEDAQAWTYALCRLADDYEMRCMLGCAARQSIQDKYTWSTRAEKVISGVI